MSTMMKMLLCLLLRWAMAMTATATTTTDDENIVVAKSAPFLVAFSPTPLLSASDSDFVRTQTEKHLNDLLKDMKYQTSINGFKYLTLTLLSENRDIDWTGFRRQMLVGNSNNDASSSNYYLRQRNTVTAATIMEYRADPIFLENPDPDLDINNKIAAAMLAEQSMLVDSIQSASNVYENLKAVVAAEFAFKPTQEPSLSPSISPTMAPIPKPSMTPVITPSFSPSYGPSLVTVVTESSNMLWIIIAAAGGTLLVMCLVFLVWRRRRRKRALKAIESPPKSPSSDVNVNGTFPSFAGHGHVPAPVAPPILTVDSSPLTEDEFEKDWDPHLPFEWGPAQDIEKAILESEEEEDISFTDLMKKDEELDKLGEEAKDMRNDQHGSVADDENDIKPTFDSDDEGFPIVHDGISEQGHAIDVDDATPANTVGMDEVDDSDRIVHRDGGFPTMMSQLQHQISRKGSFPQIGGPKSDGAFPVLTDTADGSFPVKSSPPRVSMQQAAQSAAVGVGGADVSVSWSKEETLSYMHPMDWSNNSYGESLIYGDDAFSRGMQSKFTHGSVTTGGSSGTNNKLIRDLMWLERKIADHRKANSGGHISEANPDLSLATIPQEHSNDTDEGPNFHSMSMKSVFIRDILLEPGELPFRIVSTRDGPAVRTITNIGLMNDGKLAEGDLIISVDQLDTRNMLAEQLHHFMQQKNKHYNITVLHFEENPGHSSS